MPRKSKARPKPARVRSGTTARPLARSAARLAGRSAARPLAGTVTLRVNGLAQVFEVGRDLETSTTLAWLLRERLGLTGLKMSCGEGACGACTVLLDGKPVFSCMTLAVEAAGHEVETIEGVSEDDPVVQAFAGQCEPGYGTAVQCGFCTPGYVMAARGLLAENPRPTLEEVKEGLSGHVCRCGCYAGIAQAVLHASEKRGGRGGAR
ncbi:MAG: (2Fe-2S)-binding protein [Deltaproteobacteria bacterium]|nr:(2Fe-2S)-binding protein [Deltaproteobacteria bacterium]